jgi:hypothetical protein
VATNKKSKAPTKEKIAIERLTTWAHRHNQLGDPYVQGLLKALMERRNLPYWASQDINSFIPHPQPRSNSTLAKVSTYLTIIRNVLVFVPVALTWSAVSHATNAFELYMANNPNSVANFLQFWQNGYDVLGSEWRIGTVANLDFLLIVIVIALTLYTSILHQKNLMSEHAQEGELERERIEVLLAVSEYLFDKQKVTTITVNAGINASVQNLKNATGKLESTVAKIDKKFQI